MFNCLMTRRRDVAILRRILIVFPPVAGLLFARLLAGQSAPDAGQPVGLRLSQAAALREFEQASTQEYTIAAGDEIKILVPEHADLQGDHTVGPDGRITLPFAGPIQIDGQTREQAATLINKAWGQYYSSINCAVQVVKYGNNRVVVVGRVSSPGPIYFDAPPTLLEVLAKSGAYGGAHLQDAKVVTSAAAPLATVSRCAIYRGNEQVLWVDMRELLASGTGVDVHLRRNDVVYVPDEQEELISVLGQVAHPGAVRLTADTKVVDVLAMSGGLTDDAASDKIRLIRPATGMVRLISLKDLLNPGTGQESEVALKRGDILYVPKSGFGKFGYVLGKFGSAGSLLTFAGLAAGR